MASCRRDRALTVLQDYRMRERYIGGDAVGLRQRAHGVLVALKRCTLDAAAFEKIQDIEPSRQQRDRRRTVRAGRTAPAEEVSMIRRLAAWIRKGYPTTAPERGHSYLIALCGLDEAAR
jgi:hypothetical protein